MYEQFDQVKADLSSMKDELAKRFGVSTLGLFGSITREDFTDKSDIDILVDFSRPRGMEFFTLADLLESRLKKKSGFNNTRWNKASVFCSY